MVSTNDFSKELSNIAYKGEIYSVRDNGAVYRHAKNIKPRNLDNQWTFGKQNLKTGYMEIASVPIHRIVATAFLGPPPTQDHVVDHIDTNKCNNRPNNLRWVTRLENILLNPITAKRIELVCGSVENFLSDPSKYSHSFREPNYSWMCTVSKEEAQNSLNNFLKWAKSDKKTIGGTLGDWIFSRGQSDSYDENQTESALTDSLTSNAKQKNWRTPTEFICCPNNNTENVLSEYQKNLIPGKVFCKNQYGQNVIRESALINNDFIVVLTENGDKSAIKPWCVAKIYCDTGFIIHESLGSFFTYEGANKMFITQQGYEWTGGDTFDDFC